MFLSITVLTHVELCNDRLRSIHLQFQELEAGQQRMMEILAHICANMGDEGMSVVRRIEGQLGRSLLKPEEGRVVREIEGPPL